MQEIIKTNCLSKHYGDIKAVNSLNLSIQKGEIYGFLGLNGAGKTTTIRMLLGMINSSDGEAYLNGQKVNPGKVNHWNDVGYLVEIPYSYSNLTVRENLEIIRRLRKITDANSIDRIMDLLKIKKYENRKTKHLSLGNKQRLGLAKAMIHLPGILILDEPTNGLDPAGIHEIRELLIDLANNHGTTIFISSHILGEISRFTTRIGIIHEGSLIHELKTSDLDSLCNKHLTIKVKNTGSACQILEQNNFIINCENGIIKTDDTMALNQPEKIAQLLVENNCELTQLKIEDEDLETYFLRIINSSKNSSL